MQKEMIFYYISIIMISIAMKELYRGMRKDFLYPKKLMKTLIYKPAVRLVYIYTDRFVRCSCMLIICLNFDCRF